MKIYEPLENPEQAYQEIYDEMNINHTLISDDDHDKMLASVVKNKSSKSDLQMLVLRAAQKQDMKLEKAELIAQVKAKIKDTVESTGVGMNKRQYSDILLRATNSNSVVLSTKDIYKTLEANVLSKSFSEKMKDQGLPVSLKFQDKVALHIERGNVSPLQMAKHLDTALNKMKNTEREWSQSEKGQLLKNGNKTVGAVFESGGKYSALIMRMDKESKSEKFLTVFTVDPNEPGSVNKGEPMEVADVLTYCQEAVEKAVNTNEVSLNIYRGINSKGISQKKKAETIVKIDNDASSKDVNSDKETLTKEVNKDSSNEVPFEMDL